MLSFAAITYSYERNRRALDCKPSSLLAWDVRDEQSESSGRHRVVQTRLPGNDIAARAPSSVRNKLRGLSARRLWRHLRQLACSESMDRLEAAQACGIEVPRRSIHLRKRFGSETPHPWPAELS